MMKIKEGGEGELGSKIKLDPLVKCEIISILQVELKMLISLHPPG